MGPIWKDMSGSCHGSHHKEGGGRGVGQGRITQLTDFPGETFSKESPWFIFKSNANFSTRNLRLN